MTDSHHASNADNTTTTTITPSFLADWLVPPRSTAQPSSPAPPCYHLRTAISPSFGADRLVPPWCGPATTSVLPPPHLDASGFVLVLPRALSSCSTSRTRVLRYDQEASRGCWPPPPRGSQPSLSMCTVTHAPGGSTHAHADSEAASACCCRAAASSLRVLSRADASEPLSPGSHDAHACVRQCLGFGGEMRRRVCRRHAWGDRQGGLQVLGCLEHMLMHAHSSLRICHP